MAIVLIRLKLSLNARAFGKSGLGSRAIYVLSWIAALFGGWLLGIGVIHHGLSTPQGGNLALVLALTVVWLLWLLMPILMPSVTDQLSDPDRLAMFPIKPGQQVTGLLLAGLIGPSAIFAFLTASGNLWVANSSLPTRLYAVVAGLVFAFLCIASSRAVQAVMGGILASRRGRDLTILATGVIGFGVFLLSQNIDTLITSLFGGAADNTSSVLSWLPAGSLGAGITNVAQGDWGQAAVHTAIALITIAVLLVAWRWGIVRRIDGRSGQGVVKNSTYRAENKLTLLPVPVSAARPSALTASTAQQLRYLFFRSPNAFSSVGLSLALALFLGYSLSENGLVFGAMGFGLMASFTTTNNLFGYDNQAVVHLLTVGAPWRKVLLGKVLAIPLVIFPLLVVALTAIAVIRNDFADFLPSLLCGAGLMLLAVGLGARLSVVAPKNIVAPAKRKGPAGILTAAEFMVLVVVYALTLLAPLVTIGDFTITPLVAGIALSVVAICASWWLIRSAGKSLEKDPYRFVEALCP